MKILTAFFKYFLIAIGLLLITVSILFGHRDIPVSELKTKYAETPSSFIELNGMEVHCRDEGYESDSVPIVLIHGTSSSLHTFNDWASVLKNGRRVIRMDLPGFGLTGPFPDNNYAIDNYVGFIQDFLVSKGVEKCVLGGNSLGGEIAWRFAAENPKRVEKLILINAAGYPLESKSKPIAFRLARTPVLKHVLTFITPRSLVKSSVENVYFDQSKVTDPLVDRYFDLTLREGNRNALIDRMALATESDKTGLIKQIKTPALVLWGEHDLLIPTHYAHRFHKDLPNSNLVIIENVGHVPMEESPKESLSAVTNFLNDQ